MVKSVAARNDFSDVERTLNFFESHFKCNGYCYVSLFSWGRAVRDGQPSNTCLEPLKQELYFIFMFPSIVAAISLVFGAVALPAQFLLWKEWKYPQPSLQSSSKAH